MELSVSATDRTAWVAMTPAVRLCQPRLLQSGAGEGELLPSPATPSPKSTQPNRRGHNFENRTFHLLQKPDILTCYRQVLRRFCRSRFSPSRFRALHNE